MTITSSSEDEVAGEFEFSAREGQAAEIVIEVRGSFTAENEDA